MARRGRARAHHRAHHNHVQRRNRQRRRRRARMHVHHTGHAGAAGHGTRIVAHGALVPNTTPEALQRRRKVFLIIAIVLIIAGIIAIIAGASNNAYFVVAPAAFLFFVGVMFLFVSCRMRNPFQNVTTITTVPGPAPATFGVPGVGQTVHPHTVVLQGPPAGYPATTTSYQGVAVVPPAQTAYPTAPYATPSTTPYPDPGFVPPYPGTPGPPMPQPYGSSGPDSVRINMEAPPYPGGPPVSTHDADKMPPPPSYDDAVNK